MTSKLNVNYVCIAVSLKCCTLKSGFDSVYMLKADLISFLCMHVQYLAWRDYCSHIHTYSKAARDHLTHIETHTATSIFVCRRISKLLCVCKVLMHVILKLITWLEIYLQFWLTLNESNVMLNLFFKTSLIFPNLITRIREIPLI